MVISFQHIAIFKRKWSTFLSLPILDQLTIPFVFILLGFARLAILTIPFRYYARFLGTYEKTKIVTPILTSEQINAVRRIGRLVRATASITPWESLCLVQALVASLMLRRSRLPYILHFGLAKNIDPNTLDPMKAHAWIAAGPIAVTGGRGLVNFTVVGSYLSPTYSRE